MACSVDKPYVLRLYVTDASPKSARAIVNVRRSGYVLTLADAPAAS